MAHSRLFTAHFLLLKDGTLGPWPVVEMADSGEVLSVELHPEGLKERPGLQLYGGLLMAGLVDVGYIDPGLEYSQRVLNRHYAGGTLYLGAENADTTLYPPPFLLKSLDQPQCPLPLLNRHSENFQTPLLERIRQLCTLDASLNWLELVSQCTAWTAAQRRDLADKGSIAPGHKSGLMVIKNLDLKKMAMTDNMVVKWLVVPEQK
jgi:hypothetical protein